MVTVPSCILGSAHETPIVTGAHDPDAYVEVGSFTKVITATILQQLAERAVLTPDDPVERWLDAPPGTGVTLHHLAEHTSGLPRLPPGTSRRDPYRKFTDDRLRGLVAGLDLLAVAPSGQREEYSNLGYAVLGAALVAATGQAYEDLVAELVLSPLGLPAHAMSAAPPKDSRLLPTGWFGRTVKPWTMTGAILPAGGLWATPRTLARVLTGLVLERALGDPAPGWQRTGPLPVIWHNGATGTASVFAGAVPDGRWTVVHRLSSASDATDRAGLDYLRTASGDRGGT